MIEQTLLLIKPDAFKKRIIGKIITQVEQEGFNIAEISLKSLTQEEAEALYEVHRGKDFFEPLISFIREAPVIALVLERKGAIGHLRKIIGKTNPDEAAPQTIRALYGTSIRRNVVHAAESREAFEKEVRIFFPDFRPWCLSSCLLCKNN